MKKTLLVIMGLTLSLLHAQYCTNDTRFSSVPYFTNAEIDSNMNLAYGSANDWLGNSVTLRLDTYYPDLLTDTMTMRPLVVLVHGGGFTSGSKEQFTFECRELAKRGFVAATINYRLGWDCAGDTSSYDKAVYRAVQDLHASIRTAIQNAALLRIDTSWIFVGGSSAGAGTSLGLVYGTQAEWNAFDPTIAATLGDLNSSGNPYSHSFTIKGLVNNWGGMIKSYIQTQEMIPTIGFHGDLDVVVPIDSGNANGCGVATPVIYGPRGIHNALLNSGTCSDLTIKPGGDHGVFDNNHAEDLFRLNRIACFFKSIFCNECQDFYSTDSIPANCITPNFGTENESELVLRIFPNPAVDQINLTGFDVSREFSVVVYDIRGKKILQQKNSATINVSGLSKGIYIVEVIQQNKSCRNKLMVE